MKKLILLVLTLYFCFYASTYAQSDGDWHFWSNEIIEVNLNKYWKVKLEDEFRFSNSRGGFYHFYTDVGVIYALTNWLNVDVDYRQIFENKDSLWRKEERPVINFLFKWNGVGIDFENRSRFEYRIRDGQKTAWRYRNRLTLNFPLEISLLFLDLKPYIANEIYYELDKNKSEKINFVRHRVFIGFRSKLSEKIGANIYYLWQTTKDNKNNYWVDWNIISLRIGVTIN